MRPLAAVFLGCTPSGISCPFMADDSFGYLVTRTCYQKQYLTLIMLVLAAFFAYWLGKDAGFARLTGDTAPG